MFLVGLTGGIASGKSTVAKIFENNGFPIVDADILARKVVEPNKKAWKKLKAEFGESIMHADGTLNREKLAEVIFNDRFRRKRLNEITHPQIIKEIIYSVIGLTFQGHSCAILDIPLLYESGELIRFMHKVIVVNCRADQQVERLLSRTKMAEDQARLRVTSQMPLDKKCNLADYVIDNSQSMAETEKQTLLIISDLRRSKYHNKIRAYLFGAVLVCVLGGYYLIKWLIS